MSLTMGSGKARHAIPILIRLLLLFSLNRRLMCSVMSSFPWLMLFIMATLSFQSLPSSCRMFTFPLSSSSSFKSPAPRYALHN